MIIYLLVSMAIGVALLFLTLGFFFIHVPQYATSVVVGALLRGFFFFNPEKTNKYIHSALLSLIQFCVFMFVDFLMFRPDMHYSILENIGQYWMYPIIFYICFFVSFLKIWRKIKP